MQTGQPAFPASASDGDYFQRGMSLRDWFAGKALQSYIQIYSGNPMTHTREQLTSMTDEELDDVVAREVMGWEVMADRLYGDGLIAHCRIKDWHPSTSWSAMGDLKNFLRSNGWIVEVISGHLTMNVDVRIYKWVGSKLVKGLSSQIKETRAVAIAAVLAVQEMSE